MTTFYVGMTPWLAFIVADRSAGLGPSNAALAGLAVALGIVVIEFRSRHFRPLPILAATQFSLLAMVSAYSGGETVWRYDRALTIGVLAAAFMLSSLIAPFTAPYARDVVTPKSWTDGRFLRANATLTRAWSLVLALVSVSFAVGATFANPFATTILNWLIPILIVAIAAARLAPPSENHSGASAIRALESLMSNAHDDERARRGPRRLSW